MKTKISMERVLICLAALACFSFFSCSGSKESGEVEWPEVTKEMKPWTRWWWQGSAVDKENISWSLNMFRDAWLGGVEVTPIYGVHGYEDRFIEYLSPEWMEQLVFTLKEAQKLGLGVDLANASGWPFGGPWVTPDMACKNIVSKTYRLKGGTSLPEPVVCIQEPLIRIVGEKVDIRKLKDPIALNDHLQDYALDQVRFEKRIPLIALTANKTGKNGFSQTIDLTDKVDESGKLDWTAPEGEWVLCALFQGFHGKMVERAGPGGESDVIDHFSEQAIRDYLKRFDEAFKNYDLSYLRLYFNDSYEVDDASGESDWTPELFDEFKKLRGYDLKDHLPALLGMDSEEQNQRVLHDYRKTIDELLLERFTKNWQQWAAKQGKGIRNQAHGSPANILDLYAASDIPEIEGLNLINLKTAPSAAHVTGKKLTSSESATWLGEHFESSLADVKGTVDNYLLAGVNHIFYHGTCYSPQEATWPGWLFYAAVHFTPTNPFWNDFGAFNKYVTRCQSVLQAGLPDNDLLIYYPISDLWSQPGRSLLQHMHGNSVFREPVLDELTQKLTYKGYSWDAVSDRMVSGLETESGVIRTGGVDYKALLVPTCTYMPLETFEKILALAEAGAIVLFSGALPTDIPGLENLEAARSRMDDAKGKLSFKNEGAWQKCSYGKGSVIIADDPQTLMEAAGVGREKMYDRGLECIRKLKDDGNLYYFIKNTSGEAVAGWVPLNTKAKTVAIFNPMTDVKGYGATRITNGQTEVYLQLASGETCILQTYRNKHTGGMYPYYSPTGKAQELTAGWEVNFIKGGPVLPQKQTVQQLSSWTEYTGEGYDAFSGTATYTTAIPRQEETADAFQIDFGEVRESAAVYLNGRHIATLLSPPYVVTIDGKELKGNDQLIIEVSNLMANRIADMDKKGIEWKIFYNINFPSRKRENRGPDGLFTAASWEPHPSGLIGPVTLTPMKELKVEN